MWRRRAHWAGGGYRIGLDGVIDPLTKQVYSKKYYETNITGITISTEPVTLPPDLYDAALLRAVSGRATRAKTPGPVPAVQEPIRRRGSRTEQMAVEIQPFADLSMVKFTKPKEQAIDPNRLSAQPTFELASGSKLAKLKQVSESEVAPSTNDDDDSDNEFVNMGSDLNVHEAGEQESPSKQDKAETRRQATQRKQESKEAAKKKRAFLREKRVSVKELKKLQKSTAAAGAVTGTVLFEAKCSYLGAVGMSADVILDAVSVIATAAASDEHPSGGTSAVIKVLLDRLEIWSQSLEELFCSSFIKDIQHEFAVADHGLLKPLRSKKPVIVVAHFNPLHGVMTSEVVQFTESKQPGVDKAIAAIIEAKASHVQKKAKVSVKIPFLEGRFIFAC